jgi:hypothetical protein
MNEAARSRMVLRAVEVTRRFDGDARWQVKTRAVTLPSLLLSPVDPTRAPTEHLAAPSLAPSGMPPCAPLPSPRSASLCGDADRLSFARSIQNALA